MGSVDEGIVFGTAGEGGRDLLCDVYYPNVDRSARMGVPRTGILVLYGGGWVGGEIKAPAVTRTCEALASAGYVAVGSEYRLSGPQGEARLALGEYVIEWQS